MSRPLRLVSADEAAEVEVDPDLLKLAHDTLASIAAGEIQGMVILLDTGENHAWGYAGEFDPYALQTFANRRISELLDEMEDEGEEH